jgi:uracil-DNA glycosylase family 4
MKKVRAVEKLKVFDSLAEMRETLVKCRRCKRLVAFREEAPVKKAFEKETYWRRPVSGFGDEKGWLLILGLAPSAQGGNRTGRIFTGDASARFLFHALYREGFASQPESEKLGDGLKLKGCYVTAAVKCVPPQNKPDAEECFNCSEYLWNELHLLKGIKRVLVLGKFALDAYRFYLKSHGAQVPKMVFKHGGRCMIEGFPSVYMSYHPSPQNTQTGKLTEKMFCEVLQELRDS